MGARAWSHRKFPGKIPSPATDARLARRAFRRAKSRAQGHGRSVYTCGPLCDMTPHFYWDEMPVVLAAAARRRMG